MSDPTSSTVNAVASAPRSAGEMTPDDRATSFQPVTGPQAEHYSGEALLVAAYSLVWVILLAWVASVWRKQSILARRLTDLEQALDVAAARGHDGLRIEGSVERRDAAIPRAALEPKGR